MASIMEGIDPVSTGEELMFSAGGNTVVIPGLGVLRLLAVA